MNTITQFADNARHAIRYMHKREQQEHGPDIDHLRLMEREVVRVRCDIRTDDYYSTIYDNYDEPIGTIVRPRRNENMWRAYATSGVEVANAGLILGARTVFRKFCIWYGF